MLSRIYCDDRGQPVKSHIQAGNVNLRGKRERLLLCRCCTVTDLRTQCKEREFKREVYDAIKDWVDDEDRI